MINKKSQRFYSTKWIILLTEARHIESGSPAENMCMLKSMSCTLVTRVEVAKRVHNMVRITQTNKECAIR